MRKPRAVDGMQQQRLFPTPHKGAEATLEREDDEVSIGDSSARQPDQPNTERAECRNAHSDA